MTEPYVDEMVALVAKIKSEVRAEAWEQAHEKFCPMASVCSVHLRPGDRHLLAPLPKISPAATSKKRDE